MNNKIYPTLVGYFGSRSEPVYIVSIVLDCLHSFSISSTISPHFAPSERMHSVYISN
jgi:hypothetical protein